MSGLPRFFCNGPMKKDGMASLDADTAKHIWQVLRMQADDRVTLTDGKGTIAEGIINAAERHKCDVIIDKLVHQPRQGALFHLAVAFTKNNSRNEWLLEKATELGVASIIPITASRSEKTHVRIDRWSKILQSAILQSQQSYLPELTEVMPLHAVIKKYSSAQQKLIAHCIPDIERHPLHELLKPSESAILLIGPEGDFTHEEVNLCLENGFRSVSLGNQRLRTETAAITAASYYNVMCDVKK